LETTNLELNSAHAYCSIFCLNNNRLKLEQITTNLKRQEDDAICDRVNAKQLNIINWLKVCDPSENHIAARELHEPGTGNWFIDSVDFIKWRDHEICSLWLQGIPGAGKTILCSTVIDQTKNFCATQSQFRCVYFYFDFANKQKQIVNSFLRSSIIQLFIDRHDIPNDVQSLYEVCKGNQPTHEALLKTLFSLLKTSGQT